MSIVGLDDTDSREKGMCTTYVATRVAERLLAAGQQVHRRLLVRLNPAVERKTRGNAALAIHTDATADRAFETARDVVAGLTAVDDRTSPGLVVADCQPGEVPAAVSEFCRDGLRQIHTLADAIELAERYGWRHAAVQAEGAATAHDGHGRIGAVAAIGSWAAFDEWTYEHLTYRELDLCGSERAVNEASVFEASASGYPVAWDTVDRGEREPVCVPNAPGPILYGIRGDDPEICRAVAEKIESERVDRAATFHTNQGRDVHIGDGEIGSLRDNAGYAVDGIVTGEPETRRGGHTFFEIAHPDDVTVSGADLRVDADARVVDCVAFEPTKRFRDHVRALRPGDRLTVTGEHDDGTVKLEKFAVRELVAHELRTPCCPECDRTMESAGRDQGYRCRDCHTTAPEKVRRELDRALEPGWYEVPPCARRHVAKPLVRGGFDAPTHPER